MNHAYRVDETISVLFDGWIDELTISSLQQGFKINTMVYYEKLYKIAENNYRQWKGVVPC